MLSIKHCQHFPLDILELNHLAKDIIDLTPNPVDLTATFPSQIWFTLTHATFRDGTNSNQTFLLPWSRPSVMILNRPDHFASKLPLFLIFRTAVLYYMYGPGHLHHCNKWFFFFWNRPFESIVINVVRINTVPTATIAFIRSMVDSATLSDADFFFPFYTAISCLFWS